MKLGNWTKIFLVLLCFSVAVIGFMVKLPSEFRRFDKELHAIFYFSAAAFLNLLFVNKNLIKHIFVFIALYLFGSAIELAQEYSNKFLHRRIHGRYDIKDVEANLKGLVLFSFCWILLVAILFVYNEFKFIRRDDFKDSR